MLDNLKVIKQRDPQDALGVASQMATYLSYDFGLVGSLKIDKKIQNVVLAGMGGSAFPAEFIATWPALKVPFMVVRDYTLPAFVGENTLVIASSFSGNTEETLACLEVARNRKASIIALAQAGKLIELAKQNGHILVQIPACPQPRMASLYFYKVLTEIFEALGFAQSGSAKTLTALAEPLQKVTDGWAKETPEVKNLPKQLAKQLVGKTPIVYSGVLMFPAARKWKICINENAKNTAWCNFYPELSHNEFIGWSSHPVEKPFAPVNLISSFEHPRILKRFEITERMLSGKKPAAVEVRAKGDSILEHLIYLILLGDFVSVYLAILNGVDPTPVDLVEKFKKELS
jgi:glucose/mannose-6-phosphate isomerase